MTDWSLDRYCAEILAQTDQLCSLAEDGELTARVPTCPGWNFGQLLRHVGGTHRWADTVVRTRATEPVPDTLVNEVFHYDDKDPAALRDWLAEGARRLTDALTEAGPDARVWTVVPDRPITFWARRMLHETVVHRADAAWTVGVPYTLDAAVARDGFEEWLGFGQVPEAYATEEGRKPLLGPGRGLRFEPSHGPAAGWFVDLTGDAPTWTRDGTHDGTHDDGGTAAVTVRGPLSDLLLLVYGRPVRDRLRVTGDSALLGLWLERTGFWIE
ncbi:maleylpyruvate isomerase family mycothiol-dependent enzyme [Streptomyces griseosporeus]|uniref:maleylpyruvate isomerase family mycothiol-dependent enzyme n=1 Tax=Streptomyces griseosporeus TaxID=1910 RepID=UPI0036FC6694